MTTESGDDLRDQSDRTAPDSSVADVLAADRPLACYLADAATITLVRDACSVLGVEVDRHGPYEIPNPGAHRGGVVLLDVPPGQERRFEWCRRLKKHDRSTRIVLLIHEPSRGRVMRGAMSGADVIAGLPIDADDLAARLRDLFRADEDDDDTAA